MTKPLAVLLIGPAIGLDPVLEKLKSSFPLEISHAASPGDAVGALLRRPWELVVFALGPETVTDSDWVGSLSGVLKAKHKGPVWGILTFPGENEVSATAARHSAVGALDRVLPLSTDAAEWQSALDSLAPAVPAVFDAEPAVFDAEGLIERMMGNEILARHVINAFLLDMPRQLLALQGAIAAEDAVSSARSAHSIKGASANSGVDSLVALAREMETAFDAGEIHRGKALLPDLVKAYETLKPALEEFSA